MVEQIHIDPESFAVRIFDDAGRAIAKRRLSEGEKQIFAIAVLWGLGRASARSLPAIIDTPMARLDVKHRNHLVQRYFPNASHQVIILSTDTEVDRQYYDVLRALHRTSVSLELRRDGEADGGRGRIFLDDRDRCGRGRRGGDTMSIKTVRLSSQAKEQLIRLKDEDGRRAVEHPLPLGVLSLAGRSDAADADRNPSR